MKSGEDEKRKVLDGEVKPRLFRDLKSYIMQNDRMKVVTLVYTAILLSIAGAMFSLFCLVVCGDGDCTTAFLTYLLACAIVYGSSIIAAAIALKKD
jgi:hypothetical protein